MSTDTPVSESGQSVDRRSRIIGAALEVIRDRGVDGLTHRAVAQQAGVALGLTTYYFSTLEDILEEAFESAMQSDMARLSAWVDKVGSKEDLPSALTELVFTQVEQTEDSVYVNFVLVLAAMHRPNLQSKAKAWANWLAELLGRYLSPEAASAVATVYDGTLLRLAMTRDLSRRDEVEATFRRACGAELRSLR